MKLATRFSHSVSLASFRVEEAAMELNACMLCVDQPQAFAGRIDGRGIP